MSQFEDFTAEVTENAMRCGATDDPRVSAAIQAIESRPNHVPLVTAAVLSVVKERSLEWCEANRQEVAELTLEQIGFFARTFFFVLSLFVPGSSLLIIISLLLPIILNLLSQRSTTGTLEMSSLTEGADTFLTGLRNHGR